MANEFDDLIPEAGQSPGEFDDLIPKPREPVGTMEGLVNALRRGVKLGLATPAVVDMASTGTPFQGILAKERSKWGMPQDIGLQERQEKAAYNLAGKMEDIAAIPRSAAQERMASAKGDMERLKVLMQDPVELIATTILESLPPSIAGAVVGGTLGGAPGMVAGVGLSSGLSTFSSELLGHAGERGVDIRDPDSLVRWVNSRNFDDDFETAATKSAVVGAIDAATAGQAGRFIKPALRTGLMNMAKASAKELGMQAAGGAFGEMAGSAASGQHISPFNMLMEAVAEIGSGPGEIIGNLRGEFGAQRTQARDQQREELRNRIQQILQSEQAPPPPPATPPAQTEEAPPATAPSTDQQELEDAIQEVRRRITRTQQEREEVAGAVEEVRQRITRSQEAPAKRAATADVVPVQPAAPAPATPAQQAIQSIEKMDNAAAGSLNQKDAVRAGMALTLEDVPALEAARDAAMERAVAAGELADNETFKAEYGRNIYYSGMIEGAQRKGANFEQFQKENAPAAPAPAAPVAPPESKGGDVANGKETKEKEKQTQGEGVLEPPVVDPPVIAGTFGSIELNQPKVPIELVYDPGRIVESQGGKRKAKKKEAVTEEGLITIGQRGKNVGWLLIQWRTSPGADPRTVWRAKVSDLQQAGIMQGRTVDLDKLYASPLLQKVEDKTGNFQAVKLPTERAERAAGASIESVLEGADNTQPFFAEVMRALHDQGILTIEKARQLAGEKKGGAEYAAKDGAKLAKQIHSFLRLLIKEKMEVAKQAKEVDAFKQWQAINQRMFSDKPTFTPEDAQEAAALIGSEEAVNQLAEDRMVVPLDGGQRGESTSGDDGTDRGLENVIGKWDPQQIQGMIGRIEEVNPKLYASFNADPEDDAAWRKITKDLESFIPDNRTEKQKANGEPTAAEQLSDIIREMRSNNHLFNPGEVSALPTIRNQVKREGKAMGHAAILKLFQDRSIPMNPQMRRIALALLSRLPAKYFKDLTVQMTAEGGLQGEFIEALKLARVAVNASDAQTAAHEVAHHLATFLTEKERTAVARMRRNAIETLRRASPNLPFLGWLDSMGGSATSHQYARWRGQQLEAGVVGNLNNGFRFVTTTEQSLRKDKPLGLTPSKDGSVSTQSLLAKMRNQVSKDEIEALDQAGLGAYLKGKERININELANWIRDNGPQLEVTKHYAGEDVSEEGDGPFRLALMEASAKLDELMHKADTVGLTGIAFSYHPETNKVIDIGFAFPSGHTATLTKPEHAALSRDPRIANNTDLIKKLWSAEQAYHDAKTAFDNSEESRPTGWQRVGGMPASATARFTTVNPKRLEDMPGAVDILVKVPLQSGRRVTFEEYLSQLGPEYQNLTPIQRRTFEQEWRRGGELGVIGHPKFSEGTHFPSDKNVVGFIRAYIDTLPSGEKVLVVFEVQSDWAKQQRDARDQISRNAQRVQQGGAPFMTEEGVARNYEDARKRISDKDDPSLAYYESLALKAAIAHARELGINKVAIVDAETSALTEGHDRVIKIAQDVNGLDLDTVRLSDETRNAYTLFERIITRSTDGGGRGELIGGGEYHLEKIPDIKPRVENGVKYPGVGNGFKIVIDKMPFLEGDRQHYDRNLPGILKKLTGQSGERVSFGEHQNAVEGIGVWEADGLIEVVRTARDGLVFQNPDSTPKVDVTAQVFGITGLPEEQEAQIFKSGVWHQADPLYHLINDDEYFAYQFTQAAQRNQPEEMKGLVAKVKEMVIRILNALKAHFGDRDAYFNNLIRRFERGDLSIDAQGGLLYERNRNPRAMGLVSKPEHAERFAEVERGQTEAQTINGLTIEQNEPMVGHIRELFSAMPRAVQSNLHFIKTRIDVLNEALKGGKVASGSPLRTYATVQNGLELEEQSRKLSAQIDSLVEKLAQKQEDLPNISAKEAEAKALNSAVQGIIRDYKDTMMKQARADEAAGKATALEQAIKYLDNLQSSTTSLERAVQFMAERMSVEELTDVSATTQSILDAFKAKLERDNGGRPWQEATIPAGEGKPGVSNDQLRVALRLMQQRMSLADDLMDIREQYDPGLRQMIEVNETAWDRELRDLTRPKLKSFLRDYYRANTEKDKAKAVYLRHRRQVRSIIRQLQDKQQAHDFLHDHIFNSPQYKGAMAEAKDAGFMDDTLYVDEANNKVHRRIYRNPLKQEEKAVIEYGFSRAVEQKNIEEFQKIIGWLEEYLRIGTDPLVRARAEFELRRIYDYELNPAWSPEAGKFSPSPYNPLMWVSNLVGGSSQFVLNRIGGRAAMQAANLHTLYDDGKRAATESRHQLRWPKTKSVLGAAKAHEMSVQEWRDKVADPILVMHNSLGAKEPRVGDTLWTGVKITQQDMAALKAQKVFLDGVSNSIFKVKTKLGEFFPVKTLEKIFGREYYRPQQGHSQLTMPRRLSDMMYDAVRTWSNAKRGRSTKDSLGDLRALVESGPLFEGLVEAHVRSINLYPDYVGTSKFKRAYQEMWRKKEMPSTFTELVDKVFADQAGQDNTTQMSKDDIAKEILMGEIDAMVQRVSESPEYEHDTLGGGTTVDVLSANNFLNRPRGKMIVPDTGYHYSIIDNTDENWVMKSALEVNLQRYRDGLQRVKDGLETELARFRNEAERKKSRQEQLSGEQWLDYGEAKTLLKQVNTLLDRSNPTTFGLFIDQYNRGIFRHLWGLVQQSLLGAFPVMWRNFVGGSMRLSHADALMNSNGMVTGIPKWLLRMPTTLGRGVITPIFDSASLFKKHRDYNKVKKILGEDVIKAIQQNPELINSYANMVAADAIRNAATYQDALDLDVVGSYGLRNQIEQYLELFSSGGELRSEPQTAADKIRGGIISTVGMAQEAGLGPFLLPRALAPRKIEQVINFAAMMRAKRVVDQLQLNILKSSKNREELGAAGAKLTPEELIGDPKAKEAWVAYLRNLFTRAGVNLDYAAERYRNEAKTNPHAQLLTDTERRGFYLAFMKEVNMAGSENRVRFKSEAAQVMSSLMGYGFYQNEAFANAMARFSREKKGGVNALNKALMIAGITTLVAVAWSQPWQRVLRALLYSEEDPAGHFSANNTKMRNAQIFWEQTAPFWPITGSLISQLYDVRAGGNKFFNFLPMSVMTSFIQAANEVATTGNVANPAIRLLKQWVPNSKMMLNRLPGQEGLVEVNNAARIFREVNDGSVEVRPVSNQPMRPSPVSDEIRTAVNELVKDSPDWSVISAVRELAVGELAKKGLTRREAEQRFDSAVLARTPQNTVYGKALTEEERATQLARMNPTQRAMVENVENSFDSYASRYGIQPRSLVKVAKATKLPTGRANVTSRTSRNTRTTVTGRVTRTGLKRRTLRRPTGVTRRRSDRVTRSQ